MESNRITIEIGPVACKLRGTIPYALAEALSEQCSYEVENAQHMITGKRGGGPAWARKQHWDGKKRLYHKGWKTFPTGLLDRVRETVETHGFEYDVEWQPYVKDDNTQSYEGNFSAFEIRPYQTEAIRTAIFEERCMIQVATGGGKTLIAAKIIDHWKENTIFFVHTKDLMYQALEVFRGIFGDNYVGQIGDGVCVTRPITVCTLQTAANLLDVEFKKYDFGEDDDLTEEKLDIYLPERRAAADFIRHVGCVIMDECHRVAAPTATDVLAATENATHRYGLSASPWRDDGADLALEAVFGRTAVKISASELMQQGFLVKPYIRFVNVPSRYYEKGTKYSTVYDEYIVNNDDRNGLVLKWTLSLVNRQISTLVLVRRVAHGRTLADELATYLGYDVPFLSGNDSSELRGSVLSAMRGGTLRCLVATTIADEGLDVKPLQGIVLAGGGKSSTRALQRIGRALRTFAGKGHAEVVDFTDNAKYLVDHSKRRRRIYENEPEFEIIG